MLNYLKLSSFTLFFVSFAAASDVIAHEDFEEPVEFHGFVTQGFFLTDHNDFYGDSSSGSTEFSEIALNAAWRSSSKLMWAGQVMSRRAGAVDNGTPRIDYALLDYRFHDSSEGYAGIKLGRIKNPFGFYNESRDVAFTRPSIVLPQSLYFDKARDLELSSDGAMLYGQYLLEQGQIYSQVILGIPNKDTTVEYAYLNRDWDGSFSESKGLLWKTEYSTNDLAWRAGITLGRFELDFDADESTTIPGAPHDGSLDIDVLALSLQYNLERWSFTGEYLRQFIDWGSLGGIYSLDPRNVSESIYAQAEYRISPEVTAFARYDVLYIDRNDRDGSKANALFGRAQHTQFAKDFALGIGWTPNENWLLRAEWHNVDGTAWLAIQDNLVDAEREQKWNMLALQATYRF